MHINGRLCSSTRTPPTLSILSFPLRTTSRSCGKKPTLYEKRIDELNARVAIGRSRSTEVLTVQVSLATLMAQLEQVKSQLSAARELLSFLTGLPSSIELSDPQMIPSSMGSFEFYDAKLSDRPDIKAAMARAEAAKNNVDIATGRLLAVGGPFGRLLFQPSERHSARQHVGRER